MFYWRMRIYRSQNSAYAVIHLHNIGCHANHLQIFNISQQGIPGDQGAQGPAGVKVTYLSLISCSVFIFTFRRINDCSSSLLSLFRESVVTLDPLALLALRDPLVLVALLVLLALMETR